MGRYRSQWYVCAKFGAKMSQSEVLNQLLTIIKFLYVTFFDIKIGNADINEI